MSMTKVVNSRFEGGFDEKLIRATNKNIKCSKIYLTCLSGACHIILKEATWYSWKERINHFLKAGENFQKVICIESDIFDADHDLIISSLAHKTVVDVYFESSKFKNVSVQDMYDMSTCNYSGYNERSDILIGHNVRLGKYLRREVRSEFKRVIYQIKLLLIFDPSSVKDLERFHVLGSINKLLESNDAIYQKDDEVGTLSISSKRKIQEISKPVQSKSARRSLKLMRRQLKSDICRLVEKAQLLRALDPGFEAEIEHLGLTYSLDLIARWHAFGGEEM